MLEEQGLRRQGRVRMLALVGAIVLIVTAPFFLQRGMHRATLDANARFARAHEVRALVHQVVGEVRNLEAAMLALVLGIDTPLVRQRLQESLDAIGPELDTLQKLTRDNPDQQVRLGHLESRIESRLRLARDVAGAKTPDTKKAAAIDVATQFTVHRIAQEILDEEARVLADRSAVSARAERQASAYAVGGLIAQILLLGAISVFWQRENNRRVVVEREQRGASARAQAVLQAVRDPIALVDAGQRLVMVNPAFAELYGLESQSVSGLPLAEVGDGAWNDPGMLQRLRDVTARERDLWEHDLRQRTAEGSERHMLVNATRMPLPEREDQVVLVTASDVTASRMSEERVRDLNRQLEGKVDQVSEVNRELEAFSYSVSHDLRAPLRHIAGFAEKLKRELGDDANDKASHYLEVIGGSARRMATLIDDLLVYSRLGRHAMRLQAVDMQSLVAETRAMLDANRNSDPATAGHSVEWKIAPLPVVIADDNMIRQVWQNLLGNAMKYSAQRDPAIIEVGHERLADGAHHFTVRDNGAGFDMAYASKLFGVFQRLHKASDYPGTGIGLASVRRVIARHEGRVWAEAEPDQGATFHFTLPAMLDPTQPQDKTA